MAVNYVNDTIKSYLRCLIRFNPPDRPMVAFPNSSVPFSVTDHDLKHLSPTVFKKVIHHFSLLISVCHVVGVVRGSEAPL